MGLFDFFQKRKELSPEIEGIFQKIHDDQAGRHLVDKAISYRNLGRYVKAIELLEECIREYPVYKPAKIVLGVTLKTAGLYEESEKIFKAMLDEYSEREYPYTEIYANLGALYFEKKNDVAIAKKYYDLALSVEKTDEDDGTFN